MKEEMQGWTEEKLNYNAGAMGIAAEPLDSSGAWITLWRYSEMRQRPVSSQEAVAYLGWLQVRAVTLELKM